LRRHSSACRKESTGPSQGKAAFGRFFFRTVAYAVGGEYANHGNQGRKNAYGDTPEGQLSVGKPGKQKCGRGQFKHHAGQGEARQYGGRGGQLEQGVHPGHFAGGEIFGNGPVERRAEKGGLQAHEEDHSRHAPPVRDESRGAEGAGAEEHGAEFQIFGAHNDQFFGKGVREPSAPGGKKDEGQGEKRGSHALQPFETGDGGQAERSLLDKVVVEGAQGIGGAHADKEPPAQGRAFGRDRRNALVHDRVFLAR
jgi:hypothetical protein